MKLESKIFDPIRVKPRRSEAAKPEGPACAHEGCKALGIHRAPKGKGFEGEYLNFCLEHVRKYNTTFNFFSGMDDEKVNEHLKHTNQTDGRPSWGLGTKPEYTGPRMPNGKLRNPDAKKISDPLHIFARYDRARARGPQAEHSKPLHEPDKRALETLGIHGYPKAVEIKKAYKTLVKIHHPDANGGDKSSEDRLRSIIAAYTHLKTKGFVSG